MIAFQDFEDEWLPNYVERQIMLFGMRLNRANENFPNALGLPVKQC